MRGRSQLYIPSVYKVIGYARKYILVDGSICLSKRQNHILLILRGEAKPNIKETLKLLAKTN